MDIGQRIRYLAEQKNISVKDLAEKIGRTRQGMYDIYSGRVSVNVDMLGKICKALGIETFEFFTDTNKTGRSKDELLKLMNRVFGFVIEKNYMHLMSIQELMVKVFTHSSNGKALVSLKLNKDVKNFEYPFIEEFRPMKKPLTEDEIRDFSNAVFSKYFSNIKEWMDSMDYKKIIAEYLDKYYENVEVEEILEK